MSKEYELLKESLEGIKDRIPFKPDIALVLGSGLAHFPDDKEILGTISYKDIKNFPQSTAEGHKGQFVFLKVGDKNVVVMQGRVHLYEGYTPLEVVRPIRLMKMMGAETLFLSNAAGGLKDGMQIGDIMLITDHISFFVRSSLIGENVNEFGPRFPDVSKIYTKEYQDLIRKVAKEQNLDLKEGVYTQITGPQYETIPEIRLLRMIGTGAVGMSTMIEATCAAHMGMKVCGLSLITDVENGEEHQEVISHEKVQEAATNGEKKFIPLVEEVIKRM